MGDLLGALRDEPRLLLPLLSAAAFLVMYGFAPVVLVRIIALIYPRGHERRRELPAEMHAAKRYRDRPVWLAEQLALALTEGVMERFRIIRARGDVLLVTQVDGQRLTLALLELVVATGFGLAGVVLCQMAAGIIFGVGFLVMGVCLLVIGLAEAKESIRRDWTSLALVTYFLTREDLR